MRVQGLGVGSGEVALDTDIGLESAVDPFVGSKVAGAGGGVGALGADVLPFHGVGQHVLC